MARQKKGSTKSSKKKKIEQYEHKGKKRINNPPVGLVTPQTEKTETKKKYSYKESKNCINQYKILLK